MRFEYIKSDIKDPYRNLAFEECLTDHVYPGYGILFLWQNENTIVVGRNQDVYSECNVSDFKLTGGKIARRRSGGGAVYHDAGNLNYSIISEASDLERCRYQDIAGRALSFLQIPFEFNGRNDLITKGRKFSGNASYRLGEAVVQHGTLLIESDTDKMERFLTPDRSKLARNHVHSAGSRVIGLKEVSERVSIESLSEGLIRAVSAESFNSSMDDEKLTELTRFYSGDEWIYGGKR